MIKPAVIYTAIIGFAVGVIFETLSNANIFFLIFVLVVGAAIAVSMCIFERGPNPQPRNFRGILSLVRFAPTYALQNTLSFFVREGAKRSAERKYSNFFLI